MSDSGSEERAFEPPRLSPPKGGLRRFVLLLGDQLDPRYLDPEHLPALGFDRDRDAVLMLEVAEESTHVPSHVQRTTLFLSAMRHFARALADEGVPIHYVTLDEDGNTGSFASEIARLARPYGASGLAVIRPGEWRVLRAIEEACDDLGPDLGRDFDFQCVEDPHFFTTPADYAEWAEGRKETTLEYFYRAQRKRHGILLDAEGKPGGGEWNFDQKNRKALPKKIEIPPPKRFAPDAITREVMDLVKRRFPEAPGRLDEFGWPVTRAQALEALDDFLEHRLPRFGDYQDAMRTDEPWLFHSLLSPAINLKLLDPREVIDGAVRRYEDGHAPIHAVEGFVRQILGWREFVRGVYWHEGPDYGERNGLDQHGALPEIYWTGETDMVCMADALGQVLDHGFGHHIQRLMVTGNFALMAGVDPRAISDWYLAMYVDAIDWVTLPNTLGMVMHADGGVVGTKPYASTGQYIDRMSSDESGNSCSKCRFDPGERVGEDACPFTTFYWDFLDRQRDRLADNRRMGWAWKNLGRLDDLEAVRERAEALRAEHGIGAIRPGAPAEGQ